jgi:uncharacterized membrane protein
MTLLEEPADRRRVARVLRLDRVVSSRTSTDEADSVTAERCAWTLVWLGVLTGGINLWGFWWFSPLTVVLAALLVLVGVVGVTACWLTRDPRTAWLQRVAFGAVLVSITAPQAAIIHTRLFYSTDSAAFDDVAARALLHGHDPYTVSMAAAARLLPVPDRFWTYTISGGHVAHASYPAGSFLVDMPAMLLGMHHQVVDWMDLGAWLLTGVLLFVLLPVSLRWVAGLVTLTPIFVGMFSTSGTDAALLPFLVVAVWRWDRFGLGRQAGIAHWVGPVALGAACSIKQLPWFCVPFLAVGVLMEGRRRSHGAGRWLVVRYLASVAGVFAAVNLVFVVWHPGPWLHGTLTPLVDPLVADGQGLVTLATHGITGGVNLTLLTLAGALAYVAILAAFATWYPALKRVWPLALPLAFFFSSRSLASYLVDLFPVALVAVISVAGAASAPVGRLGRTGRVWALAPRSRWSRGAVVATPSVAGVVVAALAFLSHPLQIDLRGVQTSHRGRSVETVTLTASNRTNGRVTPHFLVNTGNNPNGFWLLSGGRQVALPPHGSVTLTLYAPPQTVAPETGARWLIEAYTGQPRSLSTSRLELWHGRNG